MEHGKDYSEGTYYFLDYMAEYEESQIDLFSYLKDLDISRGELRLGPRVPIQVMTPYGRSSESSNNN